MHYLRRFALSFLTCGVLFVNTGAFGQAATKTEPDPPKNWHELDLKTNGFYGISLKQAYRFLDGKKSKTIIVAIIDGGLDTAQKDLKRVLWVNPKEIPGNGIDDDHNGYTDDINGWNFLGGKDGKADFTETAEEVREYFKLKDKYSGISSAPPGKEKQYAYWQNVKTTYDSTISKSKRDIKGISAELNILTATNYYIKRALKLKSDESFTITDLNRIKTTNDTINQSKTVWESVFHQIGETTTNAKIIKDISDYYATLNNILNPDLDVRARTIGDNPDTLDGKPYGNNILKMSDASHGTGVAGLIGAVRYNGYGIDGVADDVRIMALKVIPKGDEYDKDVVNAIHYAVDNGAKIININFGKKISPHKDWVDAAFKYAAEKDVLLVMAAGNDNLDVDKVAVYPNDTFLDGSATDADNFINVGASGPTKEDLVADFTNYGKKNVDVFAPGVKVTSIDADAEFNTEDGTSFAAPIVTGIAALCLEYYPGLSAKQLKEAILGSADPLTGMMVIKPGTKDEKVDFTTLSKTGGIVNAYKALQIASEMKGER
jgi:cell wall-associated protease